MAFAKWRISNMSDMEFWEPHNFRETLYPEAFGVTDYEFDIGFSEFKIVDTIWRTWNFGNFTIFAQLCTRGFSGSLITEFKLDFQNSVDFEFILMIYSVCFPFYLIFSHVVLSNRYFKFFCSNFILAISGSIVYYESIHNSLITSFFRSASEPGLSEPESFRFGAVTL